MNRFVSSLNETLHNIREESIKLYSDHSIIDRICTIYEKAQTQDFKTFQRQAQLNKILLENGQIVRPDNLIHGLVNDEIHYLLDPIQKEVEIIENNGNMLQTIATVTDQLSDNFEPDRIIIPRNFTSQIPILNRLFDKNTHDDFLNLRLGIPLKVIPLPLNYSFSNLIILSKNSIKYEYVKGNNNTRLHLGFEIYQGTEFPFWVRSIGRIANINKESIKIISTK